MQGLLGVIGRTQVLLALFLAVRRIQKLHQLVGLEQSDQLTWARLI
jgi:hypothetical protein